LNGEKIDQRFEEFLIQGLLGKRLFAQPRSKEVFDARCQELIFKYPFNEEVVLMRCFGNLLRAKRSTAIRFVKKNPVLKKLWLIF